jgi:hypothetical protein
VSPDGSLGYPCDPGCYGDEGGEDAGVGNSSIALAGDQFLEQIASDRSDSGDSRIEGFLVGA